eukprot:GHRR01012934.1.p1 GENE.GHRR01012934.1~~GHRR01012934.1.p1  ORF type:complete len:468 (+),score=131.38 GHRR01012934.1:1507-2910(+)
MQIIHLLQSLLFCEAWLPGSWQGCLLTRLAIDHQKTQQCSAECSSYCNVCGSIACCKVDRSILFWCWCRLFADHGNYCTAGQSVLEAVAHPGFIEFHDSPCRALVLDAANGQYKVYDLSKPSYRVLYCLSADGITDIKLSRSYILLVKELQRKQWCRRHGQDATIALTVKPAGEFKQPESPEHDSWQQERNQQHQQQQLSQPQPKEDSSVCSSSLSINHICGRQSRRPPRQSVAPLEVLSAADGQVLVRHELPVELCHSGFQVLELFDEHLLIKQALQPIMIHNVLSLSLLGSNAHELLSQLSSFMHLQGHNMFLTVTGQILATWTFKAQMVARFAEHELWYPVDNQVDQLVCLSGDWLISYCKPRSSRAHLPAAGAAGAIAVSSVVTGKPLARIEAPDSGDPDVEGASVLGQAANNKTSCDTLLDTSHDKATRAALTDVTAVLYDEHMRVIYTGNRGGLVHKWSAG